MLVKVEEIQESGLDLNEQVDARFMGELLAEDAGDAGFRADQGFRYHVRLQKVGDGILVNGDFKASVLAPCKRCLADVRMELPVRFTLNLVPEALLRAEDDDLGGGEDDEKGPLAGSFRLEDADEETFDGKTIDLDPILREQILLALPMHVVCNDDCKGLCAQCGQNLNEAKCGCDPKPVDPRLAALKDIKLN